MKNPLQRITIIFIAISLLPVSFMVYELGLLNKNEKLVRETYQNQLDAILYSVNQYSDDIISSWANRIRLEIQNDGGTDESKVKGFQVILNQSEVVRYIYFSDLGDNSVAYSLHDNDKQEQEVKKRLDQLVKNETERIAKLISYESAGFRKMEAIDTIIVGNSIPILFVLDQGPGNYAIGALIINIPRFIENNLAPKMQAISQGKFIISAFRRGSDSLVYSTESAKFDTDDAKNLSVFKGEIQKANFWLLPGYYLGITLQGASIDGLVKDRTATNLIILVLLIVVLSSGIFFLYRNIKREIQLSQAKSEFVSNVSHEIRTPLSLIGMFAETLEMGRVKTEEKKQEYYGIISKETARLSRMINRILDFSQLEANKKTFTFESIQLNDLCNEILEAYFYHLKEKGFVFSFIPDKVLPSIQGDRESVSETIINLLDNAVKYSRENKSIKVKTEYDHKYCYIEVKDEGIGISKVHQKEIFDQFYRAPIGDVHTTKGSGLGLALVKKIMDAHNGEVKIESAPGKGSTFRLCFPLKQKETT